MGVLPSITIETHRWGAHLRPFLPLSNLSTRPFWPRPDLYIYLYTAAKPKRTGSNSRGSPFEGLEVTPLQKVPVDSLTTTTTQQTIYPANSQRHIHPRPTECSVVTRFRPAALGQSVVQVLSGCDFADVVDHAPRGRRSYASRTSYAQNRQLAVKTSSLLPMSVPTPGGTPPLDMGDDTHYAPGRMRHAGSGPRVD